MTAKAGMKLVTENEDVQRAALEAQEADKTLRTIAKHHSRSWVPLGRAGALIEKNDYWRTHLTTDEGENFRSWNAYIESIFDAGRSTAYRAVGLIKVFGHLPDVILENIPVTNAMLLMNLSERNRVSDEWLARAQSMKHAELEALVYDSLEGAAQPEKKRKIVFKGVTKSLVSIAERGLKVAAWLGETDIENEKFEFILTEFLNAAWEDEKNLKSKTPLNNWEAYQQRNRTETRK